MASNPESKFSPFTLYLDNDITITGLKYIPQQTQPLSLTQSRPLIVLIHGGRCTAHNFDVAPGPLTASTPADLFSVPVIAINRPGYLGSTPLPIPEGSTFHQTLGRFHHTQLFPTLWREFGPPNNCTALVPMAHSLGSPGLIVASALYSSSSSSQDPSPNYPLAGMIFSGWGIRPSPNVLPHLANPTPAERLHWKQQIMLGDPTVLSAPPASLSAIAMQDHDMDPAERNEVPSGTWKSYWRNYSDRVTVPIMWAQAEHDLFYEGTLDAVREYETFFPNCPRFDVSLVLGAPHAIEWSWLAGGWYARCFGFAVEVCESFGRGRVMEGGKIQK